MTKDIQADGGQAAGGDVNDQSTVIRVDFGNKKKVIQTISGDGNFVVGGEVHNPVIHVFAGQAERISPPMSVEEELLLARYRASDPAIRDAILRAALGG